MYNCLIIIVLLSLIFINDSISLQISHTNTIKRFSNSFQQLSGVKNSLFITAPPGKSAILNFKIRNSAVFYSLGIYKKEFVLMSANNYKIMRVGSKRNLEINGKSLIINSLSIKGTVTYNGKPQWKMISHDNFNKNHTSLNWSFYKTFDCQHHQMLGGHCQTSDSHLIKLFNNLPPHNFIKIEALYHFLGRWDSHTGYLKVVTNPDKNDALEKNNEYSKYIWAQRCKNSKSPLINIKICSNVDVCKIASPINLTLNHTHNKIKLIFGSTLEGNPCDQSFGISDVKIYIK
jgi:hypothetical protein